MDLPIALSVISIYVSFTWLIFCSDGVINLAIMVWPTNAIGKPFQKLWAYPEYIAVYLSFNLCVDLAT